MSWENQDEVVPSFNVFSSHLSEGTEEDYTQPVNMNSISSEIRWKYRLNSGQQC
jgi:hypothetical protein